MELISFNGNLSNLTSWLRTQTLTELSCPFCGGRNKDIGDNVHMGDILDVPFGRKGWL